MLIKLALKVITFGYSYCLSYSVSNVPICSTIGNWLFRILSLYSIFLRNKGLDIGCDVWFSECLVPNYLTFNRKLFIKTSTKNNKKIFKAHISVIGSVNQIPAHLTKTFSKLGNIFPTKISSL